MLIDKTLEKNSNSNLQQKQHAPPSSSSYQTINSGFFKPNDDSLLSNFNCNINNNNSSPSTTMSSATNSSLLSNTSNSNESHSPSITSLASTNNNFQSNNTNNNNNNVQTETGLSLKSRFESTDSSDSSPSTNSFATNKASNFIKKPLDLRKSDSDSYAYNMVTGSPRPGQLLTPTSFKNILNLTSGEQSLATNYNQSIAKALTFSPTIPNKFTITTNTTTKSKLFFKFIKPF